MGLLLDMLLTRGDVVDTGSMNEIIIEDWAVSKHTPRWQRPLVQVLARAFKMKKAFGTLNTGGRWPHLDSITQCAPLVLLGQDHGHVVLTQVSV